MSPFLRLSVFVAGFAVMGAEMAAPRLLAPTLGTTQLAWAHVIGTVLAALTAGAFTGGYLADRWPSVRTYAFVLLLGGVFLALVPIVAAPILASGADALETRRPVTFLLTLQSVCLLFAPPVFLLGMVSPWAVRLAAAGRTDLGRIAGVLAGFGALGSILGTFATALLGLPLLGTRRTLLALGGALVVVGAWPLLRSRGARAVLPLALLPALLVSGRVHQGPGILHEVESLYQHVWIARDSSGWTHLYLNEGLGSQSILGPRAEEVGGVWEAMANVAALGLRPREQSRVLVLGLAGGSVARELRRKVRPDARLVIDGVELDPAVADAGRRFFHMDQIPGLRIHVSDARTFLRRSPTRYDVIVCDAYRGFYIPFELTTQEFFRDTRSHLLPHGLVVLNLALEPNSRTVLDAVTATLSSVFAHVARIDLDAGEGFVNRLLVAGPRPLPVDELRRHFAHLTLDPDGEIHSDPWILTDDRAPIEALTDLDLLRSALSSQ